MRKKRKSALNTSKMTDTNRALNSSVSSDYALNSLSLQSPRSNKKVFNFGDDGDNQNTPGDTNDSSFLFTERDIDY